MNSLMAFDGNRFKKGKGPFEVNEKPFQNGHALIIRPTTFMNESGEAVRSALQEFDVDPAGCLIVVDDVNLPVGKIRFRSEGSSGGHHGLDSVAARIGTEAFPRLRIGVGQGDLSGQDLTLFVLGEFSKEDLHLMNPAIDRARDACLEWLTGLSDQVIQRFNS